MNYERAHDTSTTRPLILASCRFLLVYICTISNGWQTMTAGEHLRERLELHIALRQSDRLFPASAQALTAAALATIGLPLASLAWAAEHPETLTALAEGTMVAVPRTPTDAMLDVGFSGTAGGRNLAWNVWRRMVSMANPEPPGKVQEIDRDFGEHDTPPRGRFQDR